MRMPLSVVFEKDDLERIIQISNMLGTSNKRMIFDIENDIGEEGLWAEENQLEISFRQDINGKSNVTFEILNEIRDKTFKRIRMPSGIQVSFDSCDIEKKCV